MRVVDRAVLEKSSFMHLVEALLRDPMVRWKVETHVEEELVDGTTQQRPTGVVTVSLTGTPTVKVNAFKC